MKYLRKNKKNMLSATMFVVFLLMSFVTLSNESQTSLFIPSRTEFGTQENINQLYLCSFLFAKLGKQNLALTNVSHIAKLVAHYKILKVPDNTMKERIVQGQIDSVKVLFEGVEKITKRDAAFYLVGKHQCFENVALGELFLGGLEI